jgi:hypothetical protein
VLWSGAPDCPVYHRTVPGAPGSYQFQPATLGNLTARSTIIHRIVRCATGLSGVLAELQLTRATVDSDRSYSEQQCHAEVKTVKSEGHRTVRCRKRTKLQWSLGLRTLTVGWRGSAPDSAQYLSGGAPDCPVHPSPASPQQLPWWGYKYPPTTTTSSIQVFWRSHSIQEL